MLYILSNLVFNNLNLTEAFVIKILKKLQFR